MSRRLHLARMRNRAQHVHAAALLRHDIAHLSAAVRGGDVTINGARVALGLPPIGFIQPATVGDEEIAEWQRAWEETVGTAGQRARLVALPSRTVIRSERPRKSAPRGVPRMRKHRRELLINALSWDGPYAAAKAYRFVPDELGLGEPLVTEADVTAAYREDVIEPTMGALPRLMGLPDGIEFRFEPDTDPTDPNGATNS